jgi:transposase
MNQIIRVGVDTSKRLFQVHGIDENERLVLRQKLMRDQVVGFFRQLPPTLIGLEACGGSHYWARVLRSLGHEVRLIPPQYVKPYLKRGKNDALDAEAICEALGRPTMRFVAIKSEQAQADLMLQTTRALLVKEQTRIANAIRGHAAEFGVTTGKGLGKVAPLLRRIAQDQALPETARMAFDLLGQQLEAVDTQIGALDAKLKAWHRESKVSKRLASIPGIGQRIATTMTMKVADPQLFRSGRHFASWLGLTPRDHSTAGKTRPGVITRAGDEELRSLLVVGATSAIQQARKSRGPYAVWVNKMLARRPPKLVAVALANKMARIAWKLMVTGESFDAKYQPQLRAKAA